MQITAANPGSADKAVPSRARVLLRIAVGRLNFWKQGLAFLRDWKLYADFFSPAYQQHNLARLQHLESLGLPLSGKRVLELGAGTGDHTLFYLYRNCSVLAVEGRPKSAKALKKRLGIDVRILDLDRNPQEIEHMGKFDYVHCYGLLYHLANPGQFLLHVSRIGATLLLETCVSFGDDSEMRFTPEPANVSSQALHGKGCRPSRRWVFETLNLYFPFVYATRTQPRHSEFPLDWTVLPSDTSRLMRAVFVASHTSIANENLVDRLPARYEAF